MLERKSKKEPDPSQIAFRVIQKAIPQESSTKELPKNPYAVALGRLGGLKGGKARASSLTAHKRRAIAKRAAKARWGKSR